MPTMTSTTTPMTTPTKIIDAVPGHWLARHVVVDDQAYDLAVVEIANVDGSLQVAVEPFSRETHSTTYYNGTLRILRNPLRIEFGK